MVNSSKKFRFKNENKLAVNKRQLNRITTVHERDSEQSGQAATMYHKEQMPVTKNKKLKSQPAKIKEPHSSFTIDHSQFTTSFFMQRNSRINSSSLLSGIQ